MGPELRFQLANRRYRELVDCDVLVGLTFVEAFPRLAGSGVAEHIARVFATGEPYHAQELALIRLDPQGQPDERYFKFSLEPLAGGDGRPDGVIVVAAEVTEHVRSRQAIERAHREREQLLVDLSAASWAKDEFLACWATS